MNVEQRLQSELERLAADVGEPDWADVRVRAAAQAAVVRRRLAAVLTALGAAVVLAVATPLGGAIVHGFDDFSAWLSGQPGEPVSAEEQQAFDEANARSWLGFPKGTQLRRLATAEAPGTKIELLGFRSGGTLCLRVVASGEARGSTQSCAPLRELRTAGAPVHVILVDRGFGRGTKREWYGVDRIGSPLVQVTVGIAADGVESVELEDEAGKHVVPVTSNSFLYVAAEPDVGQRVRAIAASGKSGRTAIPFAPAPFGLGGGGGGNPTGAVPGPAKVERKVSGGTIGWLERREPRGEPLDVVPARSRAHMTRNMVFGRVLAPSADRPLRIAVTLNVGRRRVSQLDPSGICTWLLTAGGAGGGCMPRDGVFERGPITVSTSLVGGSDGFLIASGLVSDDVRRLVVFVTGSEEYELPFVDNAYAAVIARSKLPAQIVAYDGDGKVIGLTGRIGDFGGGAGPARGRATSLLKAESAKGSTAELFVGRSTSGGECMFIRYRGEPATGTMTSCGDPDFSRYPLQLNGYGGPAEFVMGRVRPDVVRLEIRYADGAMSDFSPERGYVLYAVPAAHVERGRQVVRAAGFDRDGTLVGTWSFRPPKRAP